PTRNTARIPLEYLDQQPRKIMNYGGQIASAPDEYLVVDNEHRHQFDDLLNFYNLLAVRSIPKEFFHKVDFNYDGWRQLLYWYAFNAESEFDKDENLRKLCSPMTLKESLQKLDIQFDFESPETFEVVCEFPIVRTFLNQKN
ncbi:MAG: hypothetical protein LH618_05615, partial [Saprospiraceae bacterium]|nr:hypothetical protein [Saprospiraceae bacterium]